MRLDGLKYKSQSHINVDSSIKILFKNIYTNIESVLSVQSSTRSTCINTVHITNSNSFSEFRSMNLFRKKIIFLLVTELFASRDHKYAWFKTGFFANLTEDVHLLLKEGLKIGYSPPTQYSRK